MVPKYTVDALMAPQLFEGTMPSMDRCYQLVAGTLMKGSC
jgi:hypothetical protein